MIKLYGVPGWGSAISEVMLTLADIPYQFINVDGFDQPGPQRELLQKLNPLCQVPTLELENGAIMTETAAIALMVLDRCPDLAPPVGQAERQQFQRLLIWFVANVYPTFTYADYPERWVPDAPEQLKKTALSTGNHSICGSIANLPRLLLRWGSSLLCSTSILRSRAHGGHGTTGLQPTRQRSPRSQIRCVRCRNCTRC